MSDKWVVLGKKGIEMLPPDPHTIWDQLTTDQRLLADFYRQATPEKSARNIFAFWQFVARGQGLSASFDTLVANGYLDKISDQELVLRRLAGDRLEPWRGSTRNMQEKS